jgi:hypothetical protein
MFTVTFTDPQGATHTDAIFQVADASQNINQGKNFNYRISTGQSETNEYGTNNASYRIFYWLNQAAKDSGKLPYILANSDPNRLGETFYIDDIGPEYDGMSLEEIAEHHCKTYVLPNL